MSAGAFTRVQLGISVPDDGRHVSALVIGRNPIKPCRPPFLLETREVLMPACCWLGLAGVVDTFVYTINDGQGASDMATVIVTVNPLNDPPLAVNEHLATDEDAATTIRVLDNDSDVDGDSLSVIAVTSPMHGSVTHNGITVTYVPGTNFHGTDEFTYTTRPSTSFSKTSVINEQTAPQVPEERGRGGRDRQPYPGVRSEGRSCLAAADARQIGRQRERGQNNVRQQGAAEPKISDMIAPDAWVLACSAGTANMITSH